MAAGDIIVISENAFGRKGNYYDGTDDYVLHDAHAVARVAANDAVGTYTAWIYLNDLTGTYTILSAGDNNLDAEFLHLTVKAGKLNIFLKDGGGTRYDVIQTTANLTAKTWHHVAIVQTETRPVLYVDGVAVAMTDTTGTALDEWYDVLDLTDKFAIGTLESNNTHTQDFSGAIGQVKYFNIALTASEILTEFKGETDPVAERATAIETARVFDITMENDGITDDGSGADNGTLTGNAHYGGVISDWSYTMAANVPGHAAEDINTLDIGRGKFLTLIKRGD